MTNFVLIRPAHADLGRLHEAVALAHTLADKKRVGLTYFVPSITNLPFSDLARVMGPVQMRVLARGGMRTAHGLAIPVVSRLMPKRERGVVLALWACPDDTRELEACSMATDILVLPEAGVDLERWIRKRNPDLV